MRTTTMSIPLTPAQYFNAFAKDVKASGGINCWISLEEGYWVANSPAGRLAQPSGEMGFANLPGLLSILAGVGIRTLRIEWEGLPAWRYPDAD